MQFNALISSKRSAVGLGQMKRHLAKELKAAGFPLSARPVGHRFYPDERNDYWSKAERELGVILTADDVQNRLQDIKDGYDCPPLADLIDACGDRFARLYVEKTLWTAESKLPGIYAIADSPEEAVAKLWLALRTANSRQEPGAGEQAANR